MKHSSLRSTAKFFGFLLMVLLATSPFCEVQAQKKGIARKNGAKIINNASSKTRAKNGAYQKSLNAPTAYQKSLNAPTYTKGLLTSGLTSSLNQGPSRTFSQNPTGQINFKNICNYICNYYDLSPSEITFKDIYNYYDSFYGLSSSEDSNYVNYVKKGVYELFMHGLSPVERRIDSCLNLNQRKKNWFISQMRAWFLDSVGNYSYEDIMYKRMVDSESERSSPNGQVFSWRFKLTSLRKDCNLVIVRRLESDNPEADRQMLIKQISEILSDYNNWKVEIIRRYPPHKGAVFFVLDCEEAIEDNRILPLREISDAIFACIHQNKTVDGNSPK